MKKRFVLFVEGHTEFESLSEFFTRWLNLRLSRAAEVFPIRMDGVGHYRSVIPKKVALQLEEPTGSDVIAVIGLLDLYGYPNFPPEILTAQERYNWAKEQIESRVNNPNFHQHFAVHELEAWLLSNPNLFPAEVQQKFSPATGQPETVNFDEHPAQLLQRLYWETMTRHYHKRIQGARLFAKLDPEIAYQRCPYLALLLDDMLALAKAAGL